jgi:hypothetical protein
MSFTHEAEMPDEYTRLLEEASGCRRLAASINDRDAAAKIEALAADYERRAAALRASKGAKQAKGTDKS